MSQTGIIILCHGSRGDNAVADLPVKMQRVVNGVTSLYGSGAVEVTWAALQFNHPTVEDAAALLTTAGVKNIIIVPYFLFSGRHIDEDIPEIIKTLKGRYPDAEFILTKPIGDNELFLPIIIDRIRDVSPGKEISIFPPEIPPEAIERQSMEIIEKLLPPGLDLSAEEKTVVKRIIHASGDPQVASLVRFSPGAVAGGIDAINRGSPIFTDVRMVAAGINTRATEACGCTVFCAMDEAAGSSTPQGKSTRAAAAIRSLGHRLTNAVIAIGNAPTALLALVDLINNDNIKPALVVGMPVGFVQAAESKEALINSRVPFISVIGTRGGSAMAVAAVNALLKLAHVKK